MSLKFVQRTNSRSDDAGALTYEAYFGLTEKAFSLTSDSRFVYDSPSHVAAAQRLLSGIRRREGLLVLTGEIGTGKTTLCRTVLRELGRNTFSSLVPDPFASREDLLKMVLVDFGALSIQELTSGSVRQASRTELSYLLSEFLNGLPADAYAIVVIDEAQNLSLPLIEETRLLSDTFGARGRLQIVLVGQPELHAKLKVPEMRQVDQRVCGYHRLAPMNADAVGGYIQHRLQVAGAPQDRVLFPPGVLNVLYGRTGGVPRLINRVCDRALQLAFERGAYAVDQLVLDTALLEIGTVTLLPTWDSIFHSEPAAPQPAAANFQPEPVAPRPAAADAVDTTPTIKDRADFHKQVDQWAEQDLAPPPPPQRRAVKAQRPPSATRAYKNDWPPDVRSETYLQRIWRTWATRVAIAIAGLIVANALIAGIPAVADLLTPAASPVAAAAPATVTTALTVPPAPVIDVPVPVAADPAPAAPVVDASDYVVAVGVFADRARADRLADALTQAGLPVMRRTKQLRQQQVHQIVLGPYFSGADAAAGLQRLQGLGGYNDATIIDSTRQRAAR